MSQVLLTVMIKPLPEAWAALLESRTADLLERGDTRLAWSIELAIGEAMAEALGDDAAELRATAFHFPRDDDEAPCEARLLQRAREPSWQPSPRT